MHQQFIAEGEKLVLEMLDSHPEISMLLCTKKFLDTHDTLIGSKTIREIIEVKDSELERISALKNPNNAVVIAKIPEYEINIREIKNDLSLLLDNISDPGNMGTIIRTADWFGIRNIFCTPGCVDIYNPKVIQATMGAICRVKILNNEAVPLLEEIKTIKAFPVFGAFLEGKNIYTEELNDKGIIILGNESRGISDQIAGYVTDRLFIPGHELSSESLNVAVAAGIICSEFRNRKKRQEE